MRTKTLATASLLILSGCCTDCMLPEEPISHSPTQLSTSSVVYELSHDSEAQAFARYRERLTQGLDHDFDLLHTLCERTLERGLLEWDAEAQLLTVAGAQIAWSDHSFRLLEQAAYSDYPLVQLNACYALARHGEQRAAQAVAHALGSPYPEIRLEAIRLYVHLQHAAAVGQTDALMSKLPDEVTSFFPPLYASMETPQATLRLQRLLHHEDPKVAAAAIWSVAAFERDDLVDELHQLIDQIDPLRQEAAAGAMGLLADSRALPRLRKLASSPSPLVRIAALKALYELNEADADLRLQELARSEHNPYAIAVLAEVSGSEDCLAELLGSDSQELRANAALALLEHGDARCLPELEALLIRDLRDRVVIPMRSPGAALTAWRVVPSASTQFQRHPERLIEAIAVREEILRKAARFTDEQFLPLAAHIAGSYQRDLIPELMQLLERNGGHQAIALLQEIAELPGRPLERAYASLALHRMNVPGEHAQVLEAWLRDARAEELIEFRPFRPLDAFSRVPYQDLTAVETSRLLLEICETFALRQEKDGIAALLDLMIDGNRKNRYVLAGILLRATV